MEITTGFLYIEPLYIFAFNILIVFYNFVGANLGLAIILFTLVLRFIMLPFSIRQVNSAKKSREFQEKYKEIQEKYKQKDKNQEEMTKELAALQAEYLPAQLGGCLPLILQLLFFFQVYYVLINIIGVGPAAFNEINYDFVPEFAAEATVNVDFFGINLARSAGTAASESAGEILTIAPYAILVILVGVTQFASMRVMTGLSQARKDKKEEQENSPNKSQKSKAAASKNKKSKKESSSKDSPPEDLSFADAMQEAQRSTLFILPVITMLVAVNFPAGLSLYWTVTSGFVIIQQIIVNWKEIGPRLQKFKQSLSTNLPIWDLREIYSKFTIWLDHLNNQIKQD